MIHPQDLKLHIKWVNCGGTFLRHLTGFLIALICVACGQGLKSKSLSTTSQSSTGAGGPDGASLPPSPAPSPTPAPTLPPTNGKTYYVAISGNNANAGTIGSPWRTYAYAKSRMVSGDRVIFRGGDYYETITWDVGMAALSGTSWANATVFEAYPGENVSFNSISGCGLPDITTRYIIFKGTNRNFKVDSIGFTPCGETRAHADHIRFDGLHIDQKHSQYDSCVYLGAYDYGQYSEILNSRIERCGVPGKAGYPEPFDGSYMHGVYISTHHIRIANTEIYDTTGYCIHNYAYTPSDNIYEGLTLHHCGTDGGTYNSTAAVILATGSNNVLRNSVIYDSVNGISVGGSNNKVYNNTIYNNGNASVLCGKNCYDAISTYFDATDSDVRNNIVFGNLLNNISNTGAGAITSNNFTSNPLFVNAAAGDFHLQPTSSAINAGANILSVTDDFDGTARPKGGAHDIGAFEQ